jgi:hypothetical protein
LLVDLNEGAGQFLRFPRRSCLAGAQAYDDILPAHRLARTQADVLDDAVALIENPEHRDALRHRRNTTLSRGCRWRSRRRWSSHVALGRVPIARDKRENHNQC